MKSNEQKPLPFQPDLDLPEPEEEYRPKLFSELHQYPPYLREAHRIMRRIDGYPEGTKSFMRKRLTFETLAWLEKSSHPDAIMVLGIIQRIMPASWEREAYPNSPNEAVIARIYQRIIYGARLIQKKNVRRIGSSAAPSYEFSHPDGSHELTIEGKTAQRWRKLARQAFPELGGGDIS